MRDVSPCDIEMLISMQGIVIRTSDLMPDMINSTRINSGAGELFFTASHQVRAVTRGQYENESSENASPWPHRTITSLF